MKAVQRVFLRGAAFSLFPAAMYVILNSAQRALASRHARCRHARPV
jgi:hypothetical protein